MSDMHIEAPDWRPDELALFDNRYARWGRNWLLFTVVAIVGGIALANVTEPILGILIATLGGTFGLIFGAAFWFTGRGAQVQLDSIRGGHILARWSVDRDRWMTWFDDRRRKLVFGAAMGAGLTLLCGLVLAGLIYDDGDETVAGWVAGSSVLAAAIMFLLVLAHGPPAPRPSLRHVPLIIGPDGVLTLGGYVQWRAFGMRFLDATISDPPPTLAVRYEVSTKHGTAEHTLPLPVPTDKLDEARAVADALNRRVGMTEPASG